MSCNVEVKALRFRIVTFAFILMCMQMPFTNVSGGVPLSFKNLCIGNFLKGQTLLRCRSGNTDFRTTGIFTRENTGTRWRADGTGGIGIAKFHTLLCQPINMGSFVKGTSITTHIGPSQIINENKEDIWLLFS